MLNTQNRFSRFWRLGGAVGELPVSVAWWAAKDCHQEKPCRRERMTKNKTREGTLPPPDNGVNDARPGLPTQQFARTSPGSNQNQQHQTSHDLNSWAQTQHGPNPAPPSL